MVNIDDLLDSIWNLRQTLRLVCEDFPDLVNGGEGPTFSVGCTTQWAGALKKEEGGGRALLPDWM